MGNAPEDPEMSSISTLKLHTGTAASTVIQALITDNFFPGGYKLVLEHHTRVAGRIPTTAWSTNRFKKKEDQGARESSLFDLLGPNMFHGELHQGIE